MEPRMDRRDFADSRGSLASHEDLGFHLAGESRIPRIDLTTHHPSAPVAPWFDILSGRSGFISHPPWTSDQQTDPWFPDGGRPPGKIHPKTEGRETTKHMKRCENPMDCVHLAAHLRSWSLLLADPLDFRGMPCLSWFPFQNPGSFLFPGLQAFLDFDFEVFV